MELNKLNESFQTTLYNSDLKDVTIDTAEIFLDSSIESGIVKDIPVFSWIINAYKTYLSVGDYLFCKKLIGLINEIKDVDTEERSQVINEIENDVKYKIRVGEKLLFLIDKSEDVEIAKIIGKWSKSLFQRRITYQEFLRGAKCIQSLSYLDFQNFLSISNDEIEIHISNNDSIPFFINELHLANLITYYLRSKITNKTENGTTFDPNAKQYIITEIGKKIRQELI